MFIIYPRFGTPAVIPIKKIVCEKDKLRKLFLKDMYFKI